MPVNDADVIVRVAARGEGVTADGRHVALAAPGDRLLSGGVVEAGPGHAVPPCRHFPVCGGCQLQHLTDTAYRDYIVDRIAGALKAQGIDPPSIAVPHLSAPRTRRRAVLRAERRGGAIATGFNEGASNRLVDLRECDILLPELFALIAPLRTLLRLILTDKTRATVTMTRADQGVDLLIAGVEMQGLQAAEALSAFGKAQRLARLSLDEGYGPEVRYAPGDVTVTLAGTPVALPEGAFLQATADGEARLTAVVQSTLAGAVHVVDLFAGIGTFGLAMKANVHAVEGSRDAALALGATRKVTVEHRDLFRRPLTVAELARFDGIVIDPPRAGAREQVGAIASSAAPRLAYVSCNPATFARDARALVDGGYRLEHIQPVGQFRWSTHVELAAAFTR